MKNKKAIAMIKRAMAKKQMSNRDLAEAADFSPSQIHYFLAGARYVTPAAAVKLSKALKINAIELLSEQIKDQIRESRKRLKTKTTVGGLA